MGDKVPPRLCKATKGGLKCVKASHSAGYHLHFFEDGSIAWWGDEMLGVPVSVEQGSIESQPIRRKPDHDPDPLRRRSPPDSAPIRKRKSDPDPLRKRDLSARGIARAQGYEGEACGDCGAMTMLRNGSCLKCATCGSTTGCS